MSKLKTKSEVLERYWTGYLNYCLETRKHIPELWKSPTEDGFWLWYITKGPMGLKKQGMVYSEERQYE